MTRREDPPRVALLTEARIGTKMGGTGIRYLEIARELSRHLEVLLGSLYEIEMDLEGIETFSWQASEDGPLRRRIQEVDFVLVHGFVLDKLPWVGNLGARVVVDLYCPFVFENSEVFRDRGESFETRAEVHGRDRDVLLRQLEAGDFFLCTSGRQRDWILGLLTATGQLGPDVLESSRGPDSLVGIVPTGLAKMDARGSGGALRTDRYGIGTEDVVLIWGGGVWSWLDAETIIRAMARVRRNRQDVKLFFLSRKTAESVIGMPAVQRAIDLATDLDLGDAVIFNDEYVTYADREAYLRDADIGVSSHLETLESHFSFRSRMLDYLSVGLPILTSEGDFFADLVERHGFGETLPVGDAGAWARAIEGLAGDPERRRRLGARSLARREDFTWERCVAPLVEYCLTSPGASSPRGRLIGWSTSEELRSIEREYSTTAAYARKLEAELAELRQQVREHDEERQRGRSYARHLESELSGLKREAREIEEERRQARSYVRHLESELSQLKESELEAKEYVAGLEAALGQRTESSEVEGEG
ncbi:MAG: glycosyltransferase [bacterium]|nr:glycosyltransferase [bacterium]